MKTYNPMIKILYYTFALILLVIVAFLPNIIVNIYEHNGYTFDHHTGFISSNIYDKYEIKEDVDFDYEVFIYTKRNQINDINYETYYASSDIFEIGMPDSFDSRLSQIYLFEFVYGNPYTNQYEIVISESIALEVFDQINSVGQTITIDDNTYSVSGIIKTSDASMDALYLSSKNIEDEENAQLFLDDVILKDEHLQEKLYEKGGLDFVIRTTTYHNQYKLHNTLRFTIFFIIALHAGLYWLMQRHQPKKAFQEKNIRLCLIKSELRVSIALLILYALYGLYVSYLTTYKVAWTETRTFIFKNIWLLLLYIIPVIICIIRRMVYQALED